MAGAVIHPVQVTTTVELSTAPTPSPSYVNSFRISAVVDRLLVHVHGSRNDNSEFFNLCLSLSRGVDYAVANNQIPARATDLPNLVKQICQRRNDTPLKAAIMVLMISIKSACRNGWFNEKDNEEFHILSNEIASTFCSVTDMNPEENTFYHSISVIMSRFYPRMKMGEILAFVEATPGYGALVKDFDIAKNAKSSDDKIYLFVAQTDNSETSSCIISPQQVNFLLNGRPVDRRTYVNKDPGPQIPTLLTHMLKYGTNLLQAVGQFNGKYIIVIAFMSMVSNPSCPALPDYVPQAAPAPDTDNDIIEGPSRISLNCPISFTRIKTPVKGHLCKHLQCFDFDNYVDINSRRPSWRCPHCSQSVCFDDIRIDQSMVKVLKEVGVDVSHVKISADGLWEAVNEGDDHVNKPQNKPLLHQESTTSQDTGACILDLTEADDEKDANSSCQDNERKPSPAQFQDQTNAKDRIPRYANMNNVHRNIAPHMEDGFWRETHSQTHAIGIPITRSNVTMLPPVTDTVMNAVSQGQSQIYASNNMSNEYGRYPTHGRHVTRNPIAVQNSAGMVMSDRQQHFSGFHMNPQQVLCMITAPQSQHMGSQNWVHHDRSRVSSQPVQHFGARSGPPQQSSGYRFNSHQHQRLDQMSHAQFLPQVHQGGVGPTTGPGSNQQARYYTMATTPQAIQVGSWTPSVPAPVQTSGSSMHVASLEDQRGSGQAPRVLEGSADAPADQNWQPTGRMRGSLSGRAYSDALNQFIIYPTQPVQAARPPVLNSPRPVIPPHMQILMANNRNAHGSQDGAGGSVLEG